MHQLNIECTAAVSRQLNHPAIAAYAGTGIITAESHDPGKGPTGKMEEHVYLVSGAPAPGHPNSCHTRPLQIAQQRQGRPTCRNLPHAPCCRPPRWGHSGMRGLMCPSACISRSGSGVLRG